ncbi:MULTISPECIES: arginine N-succinyltransferase [Pseudomonas]|uniref:arginine N-succinyltransferase n=1 Tax=Pseudomonas TaxID=286 RepID=UPI00087688AF|nr:MULTISPECIES: arginine N-succinyltransferase [Pseudomonas]MDB6446036.1 arginine N-succinyltransferase [Pseudomonas sp. 21TX0197]MDT8904634.1 arginine N-succinyltransferase [Pseudomonas prosekii]NHN68921.1 arginine N-succinyltransferase [Pseudomonas fluorescens]ROO35619.1 arginine N-succinyltransferase [Pseudomonas sp. 7SR1]ROO37105.1 arginine N-succinyltransferase [Pseudomonas sp. AF76]
MLALRPVQPSDLPQLQQLARDSLVGVTSLPDDIERLREKILDSCASFEADVRAPGGENYFFVLQDLVSGRLVGCSEILASTGCNEPFYSLRNRPFSSESRELNIQHGVPALSLCQDLQGQTLLRGFHIDADRVRTAESELLSRARLMFIAAHPQRFAESVITEIVGYSDDDGQSPFWDAIGQHFFDLPYVEAERLCGLQSRSFLAELMPQYPLYVPMLPPEAQACIGRVHPDGQEAFDILAREGFETNSYVDLFDGGPTLHARIANIRSIARSRMVQTWKSSQIDARGRYLVSNDRLADYRAIVAELDVAAEGPVALTPDMLAALDIDEGERIRVITL